MSRQRDSVSNGADLARRDRQLIRLHGSRDHAVLYHKHVAIVYSRLLSIKTAVGVSLLPISSPPPAFFPKLYMEFYGQLNVVSISSF